MRSSVIHLSAMSQEIPQPPSPKISLRIIHLKLHSNLLGGNELINGLTPPPMVDITEVSFSLPKQLHQNTETWIHFLFQTVSLDTKKTRVVMMPTLRSLTVSMVIMRTSTAVISDDKVGIMTTLSFLWTLYWCLWFAVVWGIVDMTNY